MATPSAYPRHTMSAPLDIQVSYRLGTPLVYIRGELDHQTAPQLRAVIMEETASAPRAIVLDMSEVTYMDSGGLALMFDTLTRLKGSGWLGVVSPPSPVTRLMEITGLADHPDFRLLPDLKAAARQLA